mmetsp:Transcript_27121/g.57410  ORF Transcript_27121/g.57410 Transcript_27121/m.57410 type:complete len:233 (-) Transcript_27121:1876-2574(-)
MLLATLLLPLCLKALIRPKTAPSTLDRLRVGEVKSAKALWRSKISTSAKLPKKHVNRSMSVATSLSPRSLKCTASSVMANLCMIMLNSRCLHIHAAAERQAAKAKLTMTKRPTMMASRKSVDVSPESLVRQCLSGTKLKQSTIMKHRLIVRRRSVWLLRLSRHGRWPACISIVIMSTKSIIAHCKTASLGTTTRTRVMSMFLVRYTMPQYHLSGRHRTTRKRNLLRKLMLTP